IILFFSPRRRRNTRLVSAWSSDVCSSDLVSLLPQDVLPASRTAPLLQIARQSLRNPVGVAWTSTLLTVVASDPPHAGLVTMDTEIGRASCRESVWGWMRAVGVGRHGDGR